MAHTYSLIIKAKVDGKAVSPNGDSANGDSQAAAAATANSAKKEKTMAQKIAGYYAATSAVRSMVKSQIGLMEVYTGNDYQQRVIEGAIGIAEETASIGATFAFSRVAGVVTVAMKAVNLGIEAQRKSVELYTQSLEAGLVRQRAGGAFNRSRIAGRF